VDFDCICALKKPKFFINNAPSLYINVVVHGVCVGSGK